MKRLILFLITGLFTQFAFAQNALLLKTPANGQVISGGDYFNISWESSNVDNIKIEYSSDEGISWTTIISSYPSSASKYPWLVPAKPTLKGKIRISDIENSSIASVNPGYFIISEPELKLDTDSTTTLVKGNAFRFGWKSKTIEKLNIYYSINGGANYTLIRKGYPALAEAFTWLVPQITGNTIRLKIESADNSAISIAWNAPVISNPVSSNNKFLGGSFDGHSAVSNISPKLSLLFPLGKETFAASSNQTIKWDYNNIEFIKIEFSADSGLNWSIINDAYPAYAKKLDWRVPSNITNTGIIRISSVENPILKALNTIPFKIPLKSIALENPENAYYVQGQPIQISWVNNGVDFLSIKYRTSKVMPWKTISNSLSALSLNYIWIPPSTLSTDSLEFKIKSTNNSVQDSSKSVVSIKSISSTFSKYKGGSYDGFSQVSNLKATIQILNPAAGSKLNGLSNTFITWESQNIEDLAIHFSINNGQSWTLINKSYSANAKKYNWEIPGTPTVKGLIKISSASDSTIKSISGLFEIKNGYVQLTSDTTFIGDANSIIPISWIHSGISKLNISIRKKSSSAWTNIIKNYQAEAGSFLFINKQDISGLYDLKVVSVENTSIKDSIAINFERKFNAASGSKFKGGNYDGHASRSNISKILVTKPQAGEVLVAGTKYLITWSTVNVSDSVKIEYTTDNGKTWKTISVAVDSKTGSYQWTVPGSAIPKSGQIYKQGFIFSVSEITNECKIRISETGTQDEIVGLSNNTFSISGTGISIAIQSLTFNEIPDKNFWDIPFALTANASSSLPVTFSIVSGPATISGNTLTITGSGTVVVKAVQAGNSNYQPVQETRTFKVNDLPNTNFMVRTIGSTCVSSDNGKIEIKAEKKLNYTAVIKGQAINKTYSFSDSIEITNLKPGNYSVCITIEGKKDFVQCYELVISEPKELKAYMSIDRSTKIINLTLTGSTSYIIELNGKEYKTKLSNFSLPMANGNNEIKISTGIPCQGVITENVQGFSESLVYPSPFKDILKIDLRNIVSKTNISITNSSGKTVYSAFINNSGGIAEIDLTHLISGTYYVRLSTNDFVITSKVLKQ